MILNVMSTRQDVSKRVAKHVVERIRFFAPMMHRKFVLGLDYGLEEVYKELISLCRAGEVSFEFVIILGTWEYIGIAADHPLSTYNQMDRIFLSRVDIPPGQIHFPCGVTPDPEFEAARHETLLTKLGGMNLMVTGLGKHGRIAMHQPGGSLGGRTSCVRLHESTKMELAAVYAHVQHAFEPSYAIALGLGTILQADEIVIHATEYPKSLLNLVEGPVSHMCPASVLQFHPECTVYTDEQVATILTPKTVRALSPDSPPTENIQHASTVAPRSQSAIPDSLSTPPKSRLTLEHPVVLHPQIEDEEEDLDIKSIPCFNLKSPKLKPTPIIVQQTGSAVPGEVHEGHQLGSLVVEEEEAADAGPGW